MLHTLKVEPNSEAEDRLNELFKLTDTKKEVTVKLGTIFEKSYNEYEFGQEVFQKIRTYLEKTSLN